jgi:hypothetical protein
VPDPELAAVTRLTYRSALGGGEYDASMNPFLALLDHVPKAHTDKLIPRSGNDRIALRRKDDACSHCGGLELELS